VHLRYLVFVAILLGLGSLPFPQLEAAASCVAAYLKVSDESVLQRGTTASVEGRAFVNGCRDTGTCTEQFGCSHCDYGAEVQPLNDVPLTLVQGERRWQLAEADAGKSSHNRLGWVTWTFSVPDDARPGRARLVTPQSQAVRVTLR
jgi:hypothetical protein